MCVCDIILWEGSHSREKSVHSTVRKQRKKEEKQDGVVYTCDPSNEAVETGGPGIQSHTGIREILSQEVKGEAGVP